MAENNAGRMNVSDVLDVLFNDSDYSDDSDLEDSEDEILEEVLQDAIIVRVLEMQQSARDQDSQIDTESGWGKEDSDPLLMPFTADNGLTCDVPDEATPINFFYLLFNEHMWEEIVKQTNCYAENKLQNMQLKPHSRMQKWKPTTVPEMKVFFALTLAMGLTRKSDITDFWSTKEILSTPFFGSKMPKNRFLVLLSNLHLADNADAKAAGEPGHDSLHKVRPFIRMLQENFLKYVPERDLSFDEGLCPFKGRVHFRVYNPKKPNKFGMKLYQVCEASSGYCVGFDIYHGKTECTEFVAALETDDSGHYQDMGMTTKVVMGMLAFTGLLSKGYHVYMDNYYNSPELFDELNLLDTYACGTVRINRREVPKVFGKVKKLKQGEGIYRRRGDLLAMKYHDKRDIHMLSTIHTATISETNKVNRQTGQPIMKPTAIIDYVKKMGGVDTSDQIVQYYDVLRKSLKWWKKMFFHLFNLTVVNAYILYRKYGEHGRKKTHSDFRVDLINALIESAPDAPRPIPNGCRAAQNLDRLVGRHFAELLQPKPGAKKLKPQRDCIVCNVAKKDREGFKRKQTSYQCKQCRKSMCVPECFERYHTLKIYELRPVLAPLATNDA